MTSLLDSLNQQQREAVEHGEGPLLILAGAGSGKTRVITYRVAHLIEARGARPESILAVTFTNKAAQQMKERVAGLLPACAGRSGNLESWPHISTFHSFCVSVLRRDIERLDYSRDFSIYDEDDQQRMVKECLKEMGLDEWFLTPRAALGKISYQKNRGRSPAELYRQAADPVTERLASVYERYERKLRQANALDFDDLLLKTVELLEKSPEVRARYNQRFLHILVDEYQDTNRVQYQLIRQLTHEHRNICAVGDEDQSIYRWRGAEIDNILNFERDFPGTRIIRLEQNYRSTQLILDAATSVVEHNVARIGKKLRTDLGQGARVGLYEAASAEEEAWFMAGEVARALREDAGASVAVLYRTNAQSRAFEEALRKSNIEYRVVGGVSFYDRVEVKDVLAYARLAINLRDSAALEQIINKPARGIGLSTIEKLNAAAREQELTLWEVIDRITDGAASALGDRALRAVAGFRDLMRELAADAARLSPAEFFRGILERTGYLEGLRAEQSVEAESRMENLRELVAAAAEAAERGESLRAFLDHAALVSDADGYDERARATLMTLHSAKGLEFTTVFLPGLEEGLFPHKLSIDDDAGIEEERRLCYVGMTRARRRLVLSWVRQRRSYAREAREETQPSRFLAELPRELMEPLNAPMFTSKPRQTWDSALNSKESVEAFFSKRRTAGGARVRPENPRAGPQTFSRWQRGSKVRHPKYGVGTVLDSEGEGGDTKVTVSFPGFGQKKLVERYASLERM
jgi:ATP-dependent DNA helicase UvrD/PcrA